MTPSAFVGLVRRQLATEVTRCGPARRPNVAAVASEIVASLRETIAFVDDSVRDGSLSVTEGASTATTTALETTSFLYAAGAAHREWRRWASLSAVGLLLRDEPVEAMPYALLAGETAMAADFPSSPPATDTVAERVVWALGTGAVVRGTPDPSDPAGGSWLDLLEAVRDHDAAGVELALGAIVERHLEKYGEHWDRFEWRGFPLFDPLAGAAAAVARRAGLVPDMPMSLARRYLDPGLADGDPEPLYPELRPSPSALRT